MGSHLQAAAEAIRLAGKPLGSRELVERIHRFGLAEIRGSTPHKTINARLSEDIARKGESSEFVRTAQGRFSLRKYSWEPEIRTVPRRINPLEENIRILPRHSLDRFLGDRISPQLYHVDRTRIVECSETMPRMDAENRFDVVQLIPSFIVLRRDCILRFQRTKRLPEARLHRTWSINFGGHLQSSDFPDLFSDSQDVVDLFLMRELHEELRLSQVRSSDFIGALYLEGSPFERQHLGLVFKIDLDQAGSVESVEPGMHINLEFVSMRDLAADDDVLDSWSKALLLEMIQKHAIQLSI